MKLDFGIGLFAYNRPSHFKRVLISLENYKINNLIIFIDGPKNKKDIINQDYIKFMIKNSTIRNIKVKFNSKNIGLSKSIINGINHLSKKFEKFIILEDDCVPYSYFFKYFDYCFKNYTKDNNINSICSFQFPELINKSSNELNILSLPHFIPWGWGTWSKKWEQYKKSKISKYKNHPNFLKKFNNIKYRKNQKQNIWSLDYILYQYHHDKKSLYPNISLLKNIGFDGSGINSKLSSEFTSTEEKIKKFNKNKIYLNNKKNDNRQLQIISKKINLFY